MASRPSTPSTPAHNLRSTLFNLVPRHALFLVRLHVHQLTNVPLVRGEFGLKWRFNKVHNAPGVLTKIKKSKGQSSSPWLPSIHLPTESPRQSFSSDHRTLSHGGDDHASYLDAPLINVEQASPIAEEGDGHPHPRPDPSASALSLSLPHGQNTPAHASHHFSDARGMTPYLPLEDHAVHWDQDIEVQVEMGVSRDTMDLLPNELKLQVLQHVIPGDPDAPRNPRMGTLTLNLAEYADKGDVTRRYLLRQSKTNALLQLTISLECIGGERHYKAPPLAKGEVMAGVSGILLASESARTRPRPFHLAHDNASVISLPGFAPPADERQPASGAPHTTEQLIDALFNPVPTDNPTPSPFTVYDPDAAERRHAEARKNAPPQTPSARSRSMASSESAATGTNESSLDASTSDSRSAESGGTKPWWRLRRSANTDSRRAQADKYAALGLLGPDLVVTDEHGRHTSRPFLVSARTGSEGFVSVKARPDGRPSMLSSITGSQGFVQVSRS